MFLQLSGLYFAIYYIVKPIIIYITTNNKYKQKASDIPEIIKKESKDKIKKEKQIEQENNKIKKESKAKKASKSSTKKNTTKKTTKSKNSVNSTVKKTTRKNDTDKKTTNINEEPKKRGRGRPRKEQVDKW